MTVDEAINNFTEAAKNHREEQQYWLNEIDETSPLYEADRLSLADDSRESAEYYEQLAEWLTELKEAKRLLKMAVEDMQWVNENTQDADGTCIMRKGEGCGDCPLDINGDLWCKWKHEDEALNLIGEPNDEP